MALLTAQVVSKAGLAAAYSAVNASDTITPDDNLILHVKTGATGTTVTLDDAGTTPGGSSPTDPTVVIGTNTDRFIFVPKSFVNPATGLITVSYSGTATVTAALLRV